MSGFGGERGRAHTAIEAASDALAAAFVQHLADIGCNLQYQFANQFAVEKSLAHSAAKSAKPACLALLLPWWGLRFFCRLEAFFDGYTVAEAAAKGPCAAVAAEGAAEWSARVAAAQAAPLPLLPSRRRAAPRRWRRGWPRARGRGRRDAEVLLLAAADANHLLAAQAPHAAPRGDGGGEAAGSEERARRKQVGRRVQRRGGGARLVRTKLGTFLGRCTGSGRRGVARCTGLRDVSLVVSTRTTLQVGASSSSSSSCGSMHGASPAATLTR